MAKIIKQASKRGQRKLESDLRKLEKETRLAAQASRKAKLAQEAKKRARTAKKTQRQRERRFARRITNQANEIERLIQNSAARFAERTIYSGGWVYEYQLASIRRYGEKATVERMQRTLLTRIGYAFPNDVQGIIAMLEKSWPRGSARLRAYLDANANSIDGSLLQQIHDLAYAKPPELPDDNNLQAWEALTTQFISENRKFQTAAKEIRAKIYKLGK